MDVPVERLDLNSFIHSQSASSSSTLIFVCSRVKQERGVLTAFLAPQVPRSVNKPALQHEEEMLYVGLAPWFLVLLLTGFPWRHGPAGRERSGRREGEQIHH